MNVSSFLSIFALTISLWSPTIFNYVEAAGKCDYTVKFLPIRYQPEKQELVLTPNFDHLNWSGSVDFILRARRPNTEKNKRIILNLASNIIIDKVEVYRLSSESTITQNVVTRLCHDEELEILVIELIRMDPFEEDDRLQVKIDFHGSPNPDRPAIFFGYHESNKSVSKRYNFLYTKFEIKGARTVFPCFDEPHFQPRIKLSLIIDPVQRAVSNSELEGMHSIDMTNNLIRFDFVETQPLTMQQFAFAIGPFFQIGLNSPTGVRFNLYSTEKVNINLRFFAESQKRAYELLRNEFDTQTSSPTHDHINFVSLPSIDGKESHGWSFIAFEHEWLEKNGNPSSKGEMVDNLLVTIGRIARQWFGYQILRKTYIDQWLFEGFIGYYANKFISEFNLNMFHHSLIRIKTIQRAMELDSLPDADPLRHHRLVDTGNPHDMRLSPTARVKSISIISIQALICKRLGFRKVIDSIMELRGQVLTTDIFSSISKTNCYFSMGSWFKSFLVQPGYPLLKATLQDDGRVFVDQERFRSDYIGPSSENFVEYQYLLPVNVQFSLRDPKDTIIFLERLPAMVTAPITMSKRKGHFVKINPGGFGFYRVLYSDNMIPQLRDAIYEKLLSVLERQVIIDDALALVKSGRIGPYYLVSILGTMRFCRDSEVIHHSMITSYTYLKLLYRDTIEEKAIDKFGIDLLAPVYSCYAFSSKNLDSIYGVAARVWIHEMLAILGHVNLLERAFTLFKESKLKIGDPFETTVLIVICRFGKDEDFAGLLEEYQYSGNEHRAALLIAMATSADRKRLESAWNSIIEVTPKRSMKFLQLMTMTREGRMFIRDNYGRFQAQLSSIFGEEGLQNMLMNLCGSISDGIECQSSSEPIRTLEDLIELRPDVRQRNGIIRGLDREKLIMSLGQMSVNQ